MLTVNFNYRKEKSRYTVFSPEQVVILKASLSISVFNGVVRRHRVHLFASIKRLQGPAASGEW